LCRLRSSFRPSFSLYPRRMFAMREERIGKTRMSRRRGTINKIDLRAASLSLFYYYCCCCCCVELFSARKRTTVGKRGKACLLKSLNMLYTQLCNFVHVK
jgi:hypothetical protein